MPHCAADRHYVRAPRPTGRRLTPAFARRGALIVAGASATVLGRLVCVVCLTLVTPSLMRALGTPMSCAMMSRAIFRTAVALRSTALRILFLRPFVESSVAHFSNLLASIVTLIVDMVRYYLLISL